MKTKSNMNSVLLIISRILLCSFIFIGFQSKLNCRTEYPTTEGAEEHQHTFSIVNTFDYLFLSSIEHEHHHHESTDHQSETEGHSHEHTHNLAKGTAGYDLLPIKQVSLLFLSTEMTYNSKPSVLYYGSYNFRIFRPPIS